MRVRKAGALYFAVVFETGFVLGPIRVPWVVPRVGIRAAELMEMPVMLVVVVLAARWIVRRFAPAAAIRRLRMGAVGDSHISRLASRLLPDAAVTQKGDCHVKENDH